MHGFFKIVLLCLLDNDDMEVMKEIENRISVFVVNNMINVLA